MYRQSEREGEGNSLVTCEQDRGYQDAWSISLHVLETPLHFIRGSEVENGLQD